MAKGKTSRTDTSANLGFKAKLCLAADKLRNNMHAAEYKHVVRGPSVRTVRTESAVANLPSRATCEFSRPIQVKSQFCRRLHCTTTFKD